MSLTDLIDPLFTTEDKTISLVTLLTHYSLSRNHCDHEQITRGNRNDIEGLKE